jgi:hypothetical protein
VVWFVGVADGGWWVAADKTSVDRAVEFGPGVVRGPTVVRRKLSILVIDARYAAVPDLRLLLTYAFTVVFGCGSSSAIYQGGAESQERNRREEHDKRTCRMRIVIGVERWEKKRLKD